MRFIDLSDLFYYTAISYPLVLGKSLKYLKNHPKLSIINNDTLKAAYKAEHTNDMIHLVMIPIISTALYILALIML